MRRPAQLALLLLVLVLLAGCGGSRASKRSLKQEAKPALELPTRTTFQHPTVTVKDPHGVWSFVATAQSATNAGENGPSDLVQAHATYVRGKEPPVHMTADRLRLDQAREQVTLEGKVTLNSGVVRVEADRLRYNLKTAKVEAARGTKWTITPGATAPARPRRAPARER